MKKFLALALSMVFVLGIAGSAFAIHAAIPAETTGVVAMKDTEIRLGGEIRIRGWYEDNIMAGTSKAVTGLPYKGGSMAWYDQRVRLSLDAKMGANVSGRVHLETGTVDTSGRSTDVTSWGSLATSEGGRKQANLDTVLEAWIAYTGSGLLGVPAGIKAGHMPVLIGAGTFFDHTRYGDDAILLYVEPMKGTEINLLTAKLDEGSNPDNTNDADLYSLMLTHKLNKDNTVGANYSYVNLSDLGTSFQNAGIHAKGNFSGVGYKATVDFQFGDLIENGIDLKAKGWAATAGLNYKLEPVTLRANFVYGSGDDDADDKIEVFLTALGNVIDPNLPTVVYNYRVATAGLGLASLNTGGLGSGISNTTAYNIGVDYSPVKDLNLALDYYLLRASKRIASTGYGSDKSIGSELDLKASYKIAKNLTYFINSGILFAGDFYDGGTSATKEKDAVVFHHGLTLSF